MKTFYYRSRYNFEIKRLKCQYQETTKCSAIKCTVTVGKKKWSGITIFKSAEIWERRISFCWQYPHRVSDTDRIFLFRSCTFKKKTLQFPNLRFNTKFTVRAALRKQVKYMSLDTERRNYAGCAAIKWTGIRRAKFIDHFRGYNLETSLDKFKAVRRLPGGLAIKRE